MADSSLELLPTFPTFNTRDADGVWEMQGGRARTLVPPVTADLRVQTAGVDYRQLNEWMRGF